MKSLLVGIIFLSTSFSSFAVCKDNKVYLEGEVDRSFKRFIKKKGFKRVKDKTQAKYLAEKSCEYLYNDCREERMMQELECRHGLNSGYSGHNDEYKDPCRDTCAEGYYLDSCSVTLTNLETGASKTYSSDKVNFFGNIPWKKYKMPICSKTKI